MKGCKVYAHVSLFVVAGQERRVMDSRGVVSCRRRNGGKYQASWRVAGHNSLWRIRFRSKSKIESKGLWRYPIPKRLGSTQWGHDGGAGLEKLKENQVKINFFFKILVRLWLPVDDLMFSGYNLVPMPLNKQQLHHSWVGVALLCHSLNDCEEVISQKILESYSFILKVGKFVLQL